MSNLSEQNYEDAAAKIRCTVADVKTVAEVESKGEAFYDDGFPVILFERHKFYKYCDSAHRAEWARKYPDICNKTAGGYGKGGQHQKDKFDLAFSLDPVAAMKACSWGKFQLMGFNYKLCGFDTVGEFVDAMKSGEPEQLEAFVSFILACGLGDELRNHKWAQFASGYNGADYKENNYDTKLAAAHKKFSADAPSHALSPATPSSSSAGPAGEGNPDPAGSSAVQTTATEKTTEETENGTTEKTVQQNSFQSEQKELAAPVKEGSTQQAATVTIAGIAVPGILVTLFGVLRSWVSQGVIDLKEVFALVLKFFSENTHYIFYLLIAFIGLLAMKKAFKQITFIVQMVINAIPWLHDIVIIPGDKK